ncbi:MAG: bifunctional UDP-sugar hydrolase/5'-nucleotidase [Acidimicrobiia bacterium]
MKISSRRSAVGVAAALCASIAFASVSADASERHGDHRAGRVKVQLLSFNDYHGHLEPPTGTDATLTPAQDPTATPVGGAEFLSSKLTELRVGAKNSLTVAAGDLIGGSPFLSGLFHDEPSVESLEAMKLDVSSVGNHEFDEGIDELKRMQYGGCNPVDGCYFPDEPYDGASFTWLAANVVYAKNNRSVLPPTWVKKIDGVKIGFIGMTLEGTPELVAQAGIQGLVFKDEVETANAAARKLKRSGVKAIVVLLHEGGLQSGTYNGCTGISGPIATIASGLDAEIDMVVTGHTHQPYVCTIADPAGQPRMVTSASSFGRVVTETWLQIDKRTGQVVRSATTSVNHLVPRTLVADATLTSIIAKWKALAAPRANRIVGTVTADIVRSANRDSEASLGNLIADAQLEATAAAGDGGAQIALMNPGGVRADLTASLISGGEQPGQVTFGEAFAVQPFGNLLVTMDLTGAQLQALLEQQFVPTRSRPLLIFGVSSGLTFSFDMPDRDVAGVIIPGQASGNRVSNLALNGVPIDPVATYRVTTNNFLADGGDGFTVFTQGTNRAGGGDDLVAFTEYLTAHSPVAPTPVDRITELP